MDAYSAATNIDNLLKSGRTNLLGVLVTILGLIVALTVSMAYYQNFLYAIGAVFTPLFAILFVSIFGLRQRLALGWNFAWWLIGYWPTRGFNDSILFWAQRSYYWRA